MARDDNARAWALALLAIFGAISFSVLSPGGLVLVLAAV
jgi:hypothetical protein